MYNMEQVVFFTHLESSHNLLVGTDWEPMGMVIAQTPWLEYKLFSYKTTVDLHRNAQIAPVNIEIAKTVNWSKTATLPFLYGHRCNHLFP